jgi:hypothetical protein
VSGGRPKKPIDWEMVEKLCGWQATQEEIAQFCGVCVDTLDNRCKNEHGISFSEFFDQKRGTGKISLRRAQWQTAMKGNPTMQIWLGKQHLGQKDKSETALTGKDGGPIETKDLSAATDDELDERIRKLMPQAAPPKEEG